MNILCYRYGSIVEPDIIDGFKELGNQVSEICLEIYNKNTTPLEGLTALKDELMRHSYDFVFSINFYPFIAEVCNIFQIRYLCLTVDAPVLELFPIRSGFRGTVFFYLTARSTRIFIHRTQNVSFIFR